MVKQSTEAQKFEEKKARQNLNTANQIQNRISVEERKALEIRHSELKREGK